MLDLCQEQFIGEELRVIGGTEATDHEAEPKFQKEDAVAPASVLLLPDLEHSKAAVEQPQLSRRKAGLLSRHR